MDVRDLQRLHEVVTRAIEATTVEGIAKILVDEGMAVLGVPIAGVWLVTGLQQDEGPRRQLVASAHADPRHCSGSLLTGNRR